MQTNAIVSNNGTLTQINLVDPALPQFVVMGQHTKEQALINLASIYLCRLISMPIRQLRILERLDRVVVVEYQPHGGQDPILPIPLANLGEVFFDNFSKFALHQWRWNAGLLRENQEKWTKEAHRLIGKLVDDLTDGQELNQKERQYFLFQLALSVARPLR